MRLLWTGAAPWCQSGYGKPLRYLFPRLAAAGHEIALCAFYGWDGTTTETDVGGATVRIYPPARDGYFNDIIEYHAASWKAEAVAGEIRQRYPRVKVHLGYPAGEASQPSTRRTVG